MDVIKCDIIGSTVPFYSLKTQSYESLWKKIDYSFLCKIPKTDLAQFVEPQLITKDPGRWAGCSDRPADPTIWIGLQGQGGPMAAAHIKDYSSS